MATAGQQDYEGFVKVRLVLHFHEGAAIANINLTVIGQRGTTVDMTVEIAASDLTKSLDDLSQIYLRVPGADLARAFHRRWPSRNRASSIMSPVTLTPDLRVHACA